MSKRRFQWVGCAIPLMLCASGARLLAAEPGVDFSRDIKPILSNICYKCHGPDANERKGGTKGHALRLDTEEGALANYDGTVPVVPGHPEKDRKSVV